MVDVDNRLTFALHDFRLNSVREGLASLLRRVRVRLGHADSPEASLHNLYGRPQCRCRSLTHGKAAGTKSGEKYRVCSLLIILDLNTAVYHHVVH